MDYWIVVVDDEAMSLTDIYLSPHRERIFLNISREN